MQASSFQAPIRPSLSQLFGEFFGIGMLGFGGVLPLARRMIVERRRWLTPAEFTDLLALCQFLPGPNVVNLSVALGGRVRGPAGALAAVLGLLGGPMLAVIALGLVYDRFAGVPAVARALDGLAAAASGLVLATALRIAAPLRHRPGGIAVAAAALLAVAVLRAPLPLVLLALAPAGMLLARKGL
ncbi:MAG TPA: chromate transporter [Acetobacteraceae bacterium]|nr:chromate transporter [Acetobacteraceae bacterium]